MMRTAFFYLSACMALLLINPPVSSAKNGWVSDMLVLTFRQGPGINYTVERSLPSNTPVTILDEKKRFFSG